MIIYNYDKDGKFTRQAEARVNPRPDPNITGDEYLIPANATTVKPPNSVLDGTTYGYWIGNSWSSVPIPDDQQDATPIERRRAVVMAEIDAKTETILVYGFKIDDQPVRLTANDQRNHFTKYLTLWLQEISGGIPEGTLPMQLKVWSDKDGAPVYMAIGTWAEYTALFTAGNKHIEDTLQSGYDLKASVAKMTEAQLKTFEDTREI